MDNVLPWTMLHVSMGIPFLAASCNSVQHMNDRIVCGKSAPLVVPCVCLTHAGNGGFYYRSRTVTTHTPASVSRGRSTVTFMSFLLDSSSGRCVEGGGGGFKLHMETQHCYLYNSRQNTHAPCASS